MSDVSDMRTLLRVERGRPGEEDLAAVAVTLLSLYAGRRQQQAGAEARSVARWQRLDRTPAYRAPHSWQ
ncbi:acyl-CoA carboxylase subunit epsilon [Streptomyces sp. CA-210063]|uniref:acyl-CoA carboxylase subunit epsilon n=1 Tax=Streptomyces sp. CA-210063 TaxID=2801029 RepID=UPI00214C96D0|nr:acyl-CoA carboxylase subunit epsilon [Streptomyces sp. CA-210063]UUU30229.1 acyl-CoA carboxylase subunit epsilon [Streptomyces sp. CA-210063]